MDLRDFVALTMLAAGGEVQGKTKLQKLVYFMGVLSEQLDELGYRPHFYGPYSDEVAYAIGQLCGIGVVDQNETEWGYDRRGFEVKRYDYRLNEAGKQYAETLANAIESFGRKSLMLSRFTSAWAIATTWTFRSRQRRISCSASARESRICTNLLA